MRIYDKLAILAMSTKSSSENEYIGGGDILKYIGNSDTNKAFDEMNTAEMFKYAVLPMVKYIAIILLTVIVVTIILRSLKVTITKRGKGAEKQLKNIEKIRKKERTLIAINTAMNKLTNFVEHSPFRISKAEAKSLEYKIHRADIKSLDGRTLMKAEQYNALQMLFKTIMVVIGIIMILTVNITFGTILIVLSLAVTNAACDIYIKEKVSAKDAEIKENFTGFYLMIHYVLMRNPNASLVPIILSYDKTTDSEEMHKLVDICVHNMNTYGEYSGSNKISEEYKGVQEVAKLMRLIRQGGAGGDIRSELEGFKRELISEEAYRAEKVKQKALAKADRGKVIVFILLAQGIISAMMIYLSDLGTGIALF